ncbi:hypothetical protein GCM10009676_40970 [Prauserella halophila]|uniref:PE family protein n=1 Tax=Prauserella halophila TaxID=185641 RepID=A0ABP4H807_9PSEU|nr:hypothetical protein [Prauserella halophila]MCP2236745.1 hypothetical protein [Prauserella halophila]
MAENTQSDDFWDKITPWKSSDFVITPWFDVDDGGAGGASGFVLDEESADDIYKALLKVVDKFDVLKREAGWLTRTEPPAQDPASVDFNTVGNKAFELGSDHVAAEYMYWRNLTQALGKALEAYRTADEDAKDDITKTGGDGDSGGGLLG